MKNEVSGVAGAVRVDQMTMLDLTNAERHGKRLDVTSQFRAINNEPPFTTTGLDLKALFDAHIEGAFVPRAHYKAMHVLIQFPKALVDGEDGATMLHHARAFTKRVFDDQAIFADRVDRDEKSRHVVDVFVAPKYVKKTKHQEKVAVTMSRHLKDLARQYGRDTDPRNTGRALQDALLDYLRDEMGLANAQRGSAKQAPGPDWKSAEQLRVEELDDQKVELDERQNSLEVRERETNEAVRSVDADRRALAVEAAAAAKASAEREGVLDRRNDKLDIQELASAADRDALDRREQDLRREQRNVVEARAAVERARLDAEHLRERLAIAEHGAAMAEASAKEKVVAAKMLSDVAEADRAAAADELTEARNEREELAARHAIQQAQAELLAQAAEPGSTLGLRRTESSFAMNHAAMTVDQRATYKHPWDRPLIAMARAIAAALETARRLVARLREREATVDAREAKVAEAEATARIAERELETRTSAQIAKHERAMEALEQRKRDAQQVERRAAETIATADTKVAAATETQTEADAAMAMQRNWQKALSIIVSHPEIAQIDDEDAIRIDPLAVGTAPPWLVETLSQPTPPWAKEIVALRQYLDTSLARQEAQEKETAYAVERLQDMISRAGPILTPVQQEVVAESDRIVRRYGPAQNVRNDEIER